ncbi:uncharacterized protein PADG_03547 [Paracoccidioides brasiliensis Pb18]|uniref:Alpha/beta hydrolase fold-3 domain-containing protein n=1 Tax=Paracoccidioides brasiliensis (strain Pb18) TaxID=502780 RepID=C1G8G1_PARBD|nr:uncharacterized protein PADG_03547 [Paracoccidioides brasiliensis Pb18]EEH47463.2 hypothetical protein PADG_03547 [Paracoccidioides brasiliensis Pb18]
MASIGVKDSQSSLSEAEAPPRPKIEPCLHVPQPTLHFVTPPSASETGPILLYFHGGGYVNPLQAPGHMPFALRCAAACKAKEVVFLEYSLAPEHPYPSQLVQAVADLRYLLNELSLRADDIIIAGDSAGGNLTGSLLTHIAKPSPYAAPLDLAGRQLEAVLLVSPWVMMGTNQGSYHTNHRKDFLTLAQENWFKAQWNANGIANEEEVWANLCEWEGARDVWNGVFPSSGESQGLVKKAMVTVGTAEVLLDSCRVFAKDCVKAEMVVAQRETDWSVFHGKDFVFAECEGEVHVQPALDLAVKYYEGYMMRAVLSWLESV